MLNPTTTLFWLILFATGFTLAGVLYARRSVNTVEEYIVARNSQTTTATMLTLMATSLGAWILFAPAQAAAWGGLGAIIGYALGAMAPRFAIIPLGHRIRTLVPEGHTLSEVVLARYGYGMYGLILLIMVFYLFIAITAEITAIAKLVALLAPIPLGITALIVLSSTLIYTAYGGLKASIFTDKIQMLIILPLLGLLITLGWQAAGDITIIKANLRQHAPQLLNWNDPGGIRAGITFFVAILLTGLFHQGNWQRIYAAKSTTAMRHGFLLAGVLVAPIIGIMGVFGLAFAAQGSNADSSTALFSLLLPTLAPWAMVAIIPLGLALVMSSADTAISATSSLIAVDVRRFFPAISNTNLMRLARLLIVPLMIPVWLTVSQGYSVLYLFLLADILCSAAAFPVFFGLFNSRYSGRVAILSTVTGLVCGLSIFPGPNDPPTLLLESFLLAALVPVIVSIIALPFVPTKKHYDFGQLNTLIRRLDHPS